MLGRGGGEFFPVSISLGRKSISFFEIINLFVNYLIYNKFIKKHIKIEFSSKWFKLVKNCINVIFQFIDGDKSLRDYQIIDNNLIYISLKIINSDSFNLNNLQFFIELIGGINMNNVNPKNAKNAKLYVEISALLKNKASR